MPPADISWADILAEPFVGLVLGNRGEGKTALSHRLLEVFSGGGERRDAYILGFPADKEHLLPSWVDVLPETIGYNKWPEDSVVLIHEAHHLLHARRSMDTENLEIDKLVTVSRHKNSDVIFETQQSHRLDKNSVAAVDAVICRYPALMQEQFERREVRPIIEAARDTLDKYVTVHENGDYTYVERDTDENGVERLKKHAYVHAGRFRGEYPHEIVLPDHWSEEISKAYSDIDADSGGGERDATARGTSINSLSELRNDNG
jgi:hypothetical protein